ncbi:P63C domain-containing protein [Brevibacillus brevis]|uniref:P63C domain-containing protein n=1 Tax=Brevibacillus brevis TaxID=1393 RepID=UPI0007D8A004|nr:P63C domain-containing protein [Brevibacillus brevis]
MFKTNILKKGSDKVKSNTEKIIHYGCWEIDGKEKSEVDCFVTDTGRRLVSLRGASRIMGLVGGGSKAVVRNLTANYMQQYLSEPLKNWLQSVLDKTITKLKTPKGKEIVPFDGELFVDVCSAYINAQKDGVFKRVNGNQNEIANNLSHIVSAFAKTGIVALIDEVTGYQGAREKDELQKILAKYIREEYLPWTSRFPEEFYTEMFRLKRWEYKGKKKPPLVGKITNKLVYEALPDNVLKRLQELNPVLSKGYRKYRHHQFLTEDFGVIHLDKHLVKLVTLMQISDSWEEFESRFTRLFYKEINGPKDDGNTGEIAC